MKKQEFVRIFRATRHLATVALLAVPSAANAQLTWSDVLFFAPPDSAPAYAGELLAKAQADECFDGIGVDYPPINQDGTCDIGVPKHNQGYVWGLAQVDPDVPSFEGDEVWLGTVPNPLCTASPRFFDPEPEIKVSWVCEYGESEPARRDILPLPANIGDWRRPRMYSYNLQTGILTDRTPLADTNAVILGGLRSGGAIGSTIFLAGPTLFGDVAFFAWDATDNTYLGSCLTQDYNNIRSWVEVNGTLYTGVGKPDGTGRILRWVGTEEDPLGGPPSSSCGFEEAAELPGLPAYIASYNDERLAVSLWTDWRFVTPTRLLNAHDTPRAERAQLFPVGLYISPLIDTELFSNARAWSKVWSPFQYEPDVVVATTTNGGALSYWNGWVWFGSMHVTTGTTKTHMNCPWDICYGMPADEAESIDVLFNSHRASSIWRARLNEQGDPEVELLYGESELPALVSGTRTFEMQPTGFTPLYGSSGFDNPFNTYIWTSVTTDDHLFIGTYDYRYVFDVNFGLGIEESEIWARGYGADLWRFDAVDQAAQPEDLRGNGNYTNYGIRAMLKVLGTSDVLVGTANALNLAPESGWELQRLTPTVP